MVPSLYLHCHGITYLFAYSHDEDTVSIMLYGNVVQSTCDNIIFAAIMTYRYERNFRIINDNLFLRTIMPLQSIDETHNKNNMYNIQCIRSKLVG